MSAVMPTTPTTAAQQLIMSTPEVSELTGVPETTLRWFRHQGTGPRWFKLGNRKVAYKRADVLAWIDDQYEMTGPGKRA